MRTTEDLQAALQQCKGSDRWQRIAKHAGCHYFTVARIARTKGARPSFAVASAIFAAIAATEDRPTKAAA